MRLRIWNHRNGKFIATRATVAIGFGERFWGLMGRHHLDDQEALFIPRCNSIHTFFMLFPIDVLFLCDGRVAAMRECLEPYRIAMARGQGCDVLELASGCLERSGTRLGDRIRWERI
ncbi:MAG: DUF192 domain-containing protein [Vicinamibacteria bacterium]